MSQSIYVGNLPFTASEDEIRDLFADHGEVKNVNIIMDRDTGRPRGFAFVEMDQEGAEKAVAAVNGMDFGGRSLKVDLAKPRDNRGGGGGGRRRDNW